MPGSLAVARSSEVSADAELPDSTNSLTEGRPASLCRPSGLDIEGWVYPVYCALSTFYLLYIIYSKTAVTFVDNLLNHS